MIRVHLSGQFEWRLGCDGTMMGNESLRPCRYAKSSLGLVVTSKLATNEVENSARPEARWLDQFDERLERQAQRHRYSKRARWPSKPARTSYRLHRTTLAPTTQPGVPASTSD